MTTKERLHELVDRLPEGSENHAEEYLRYLLESGDPVLAALKSAPLDDEPETQAERKAAEEARKDVQANRVVSHEAILREFRG